MMKNTISAYFYGNQGQVIYEEQSSYRFYAIPFCWFVHSCLL